MGIGHGMCHLYGILTIATIKGFLLSPKALLCSWHHGMVAS